MLFVGFGSGPAGGVGLSCDGSSGMKGTLQFSCDANSSSCCESSDWLFTRMLHSSRDAWELLAGEGKSFPLKMIERCCEESLQQKPVIQNVDFVTAAVTVDAEHTVTWLKFTEEAETEL